MNVRTFTDAGYTSTIVVTTAQAGTILVAVSTSGETPDFTQTLLAQQLDNLP